MQVAGVMDIAPSFTLRFQHAQLLMSRYRAGLPYAGLLKMLSHEYQCIWQDTGSISVIKTLIVEDSLIVHVTSPLRILTSWDLEDLVVSLPDVCPHWQSRLLLKTMLCCLKHRDGELCSRCSGWQSCEDCQTSFILSAQGCDALKLRLSVDVRRFLGSCKTPFDPDWWEHCETLPAIAQRKARARTRID